jgi:hypothetical protein
MKFLRGRSILGMKTWLGMLFEQAKGDRWAESRKLHSVRVRDEVGPFNDAANTLNGVRGFSSVLLFCAGIGVFSSEVFNSQRRC